MQRASRGRLSCVLVLALLFSTAWSSAAIAGWPEQGDAIVVTSSSVRRITLSPNTRRLSMQARAGSGNYSICSRLVPYATDPAAPCSPVSVSGATPPFTTDKDITFSTPQAGIDISTTGSVTIYFISQD